MGILRIIYKITGRSNPPYYADYPLWLVFWKPLRKWINVVLAPNIVCARVRILLYRIVGFKIGRNVFIGMRCYLDDVDPAMTTIDDNVTISYGTYFATHGRNQKHTPIRIEEGAYIGMRCSIISGRDGVTIGRGAIIGAGSLINKSIPDNVVAAGSPARVLRTIDTAVERKDHETENNGLAS